MKIAIVHDLLTQMGGAERVVEVLHEMYPEAPIYTLALNRERLSDALRKSDIRTTWIQKIPGVEANFKKLLPLYPIALRQLTLEGYDAVISSSFAFVKGVRVPQDTFHFCYCYTPMRFAWDFENYIEREAYPKAVKSVLRQYVKYLRYWDEKTANRVDSYVAISSVVKKRLQMCYRRESEIIFPPVHTSRFSPSRQIDSYYLLVSRLVSYKRIDLAVEAFNQLGLPLYIVGDGPDRGRLKSMAKSNIQFLGRLPDEEVGSLMSRCRALLFPGEEDFGITPLEANAAGRPVVAYRAGGALDTIIPYKNGLFFDEQKPDSVIAAIRQLENFGWDAGAIVAHAKTFDTEVFKQRFHQHLFEVYRHHLSGINSRRAIP